jgi:hypothetical protein
MEADWTKYQIKKTSTKAKLIVKIIDSAVGHACQDKLMYEQIDVYEQEARNLGVTDPKAVAMCINIRHQGGLSAVKRILAKTKKPYTKDSIYDAMKTDTGNQVGTYTTRQKKVSEWLDKYMTY